MLNQVVVQIIAAGDDGNGGVLHVGRNDELARIKNHAQALARTLRIVGKQRRDEGGFAGCICLQAPPIPAFSSAAFFSSTTTSGNIRASVLACHLGIVPDGGGYFD